MLRHQMKLYEQPFNQICSGQKIIELRLYDEKRKQIKLNDEIEFSCIDKKKKPLLVRVTALHRFKNFAELYNTLPLTKCGYTKETIAAAAPEDMNRYYSPEEQSRFGVVGIEIRLINKNDDEMLRTSRFLSLVLRHKPQAAGITVDPHGWADVHKLIEGVNKTHPLTPEELKIIVKTDNKQRYSFNSDKTKIRANQGHSIPVDVELTECEPPEVLYHGTGQKFAESIIKNGLVAKSRLYVHLSAELETAKVVGLRHGTPVVFTVLSGQMHRDGVRFYRSENGVWLTNYVSPGYLTST